jgi:hypothetical protein
MITDKDIDEALDRIARTPTASFSTATFQKTLMGTLAEHAPKQSALRTEHGRRRFAAELMAKMAKGIDESGGRNDSSSRASERTVVFRRPRAPVRAQASPPAPATSPAPTTPSSTASPQTPPAATAAPAPRHCAVPRGRRSPIGMPTAAVKPEFADHYKELATFKATEDSRKLTLPAIRRRLRARSSPTNSRRRKASSSSSTQQPIWAQARKWAHKPACRKPLQRWSWTLRRRPDRQRADAQGRARCRNRQARPGRPGARHRGAEFPRCAARQPISASSWATMLVTASTSRASRS